MIRKPAAIEISPFERQTASKFLLSLLNRPSETDPTNDEELALKIAGSVGNFPLALDLIGCFIRKCGITMQQFVLEHPAFERELIKDGLGYTENDYRKPIATIWTLNRNRLSTDAKLILYLLALLDGDGAPSSLVNHGKSKEDM